jgi:predicted MPP superfamily phosphohydrolase
MLPYLQVQLCYAAAAAALVLAVDRALGRVPRVARSPRLRAGATLMLLALALIAWMVAVKRIDHSHSTYQFIAVALGFYVATLWLPAWTLARALRNPRDIALSTASTAALALGQYALWIEPNRLVVAEHAIPIERWPAGVELRVVHVSDLQTVGACAREREAARIVRELEPDLVVFTGDYVAGPFFDPRAGIEAARSFLESLGRPPLGIVCVDGHSEPERVRLRVFDGLDVTCLQNESVDLDDGAGRRLRVFGTRTLQMGFDLAPFEPRQEAGWINVAVSHEPDVSRAISGRGFDVHFAGHTHGGQIALPFFGPPLTLSTLPRRFARGLHRFDDHWIHVNAGIGMEGNHAPRIRCLCPPEVSLVVLRGSGGAADRVEPVGVRR